MVEIGDFLPDFILPNENSNEVDISQHRGKSPLVIFFYPKDDTPGCTLEACAFRDNFDEFSLSGVTIFGISSDDPSSHHRFIRKYSLPFSLLSDVDLTVHRIFGVDKTLGLFPGRVTYVTNGLGMVCKIFRSQLFPRRHIYEALKAIKRL